MKWKGIGLIAACGLALLTGCSAGKDVSGAAGSAGGNPGSSARMGDGEDSGASRAKGRYMEEEIQLPEELQGMALANVFQRQDKSLEFLLIDSSKKTHRYLYDGSTFADQGEIPGLNGINAVNMYLGQDGSYYYGGYGEGVQFHLWKKEAGEVKEVFAQAFEPQEGREYGISPDYLMILEDGSLMLSTVSNAKVISPDGKEKFSMEQEFIGMDVRTSAHVWKNHYLTLNEKQIVRYDLDTGELSGTYENPEKNNAMGVQMVIFSDDSSGIYSAGPSGLYHIGKEGTLWEQLIDGSLNSMGRQDIYLRAFFEGKENDFYGVFSSMDKFQIFRYVFDPEADAVPPETLTVYSLRDNPSVRQAAAILQKNNSQLKVEFRIAVEDPEEEITEDVLRALNAELLNGKGADVLILDGLPAEAYQEKGVLADMKPLFEGLKEELLPGVTDDFVDESGSAYYMPIRINVPVIFGEPEAVSALQSLDKMAAYEGAPPLLATNIYENLLRITAHTCYQELFGENEIPDQKTLSRFLSTVKSAGEKSGAKESFTQDEMVKYNVNNYVSANGFGHQGDFAFASGVCPVGAEVFDSVYSTLLTFAAADLKGVRLESMNQTYIPSGLVGINASSPNRENAEAFVQTLFGREVQDESLYDGFPVRKDSLEAWSAIDRGDEYSVSASMREADFSLNGKWPDEAQRKLLKEIVSSADTPILIDQQVLNLIVDGSRDYLNNKEELDTAVQAIENKLRLYANEKE